MTPSADVANIAAIRNPIEISGHAERHEDPGGCHQR
jgi:hypothetical protein